MNYLRACLLLSVLVCVGCQDVHTVQKTGTEFSGGSRAVTYVTPGEYDRMTPAERERINAGVGVETTVVNWGKQPPRDLTFEELPQAKQGAKDSP
jgi:hypothetical protein